MMNIVGERFGRLEIISLVGKDSHRNLLWLCQCQCGNTTTQRTNTLRIGLVKSCGCYLREFARSRMLNENNPMWSGKDASLGAVHSWVRERKSKPELCEKCGQRKPKDLANISGDYKRDVSDYEWLCRTCHMTSDGRMKRRKENGQFERTCIHPLRVDESL